VRAEPRADAEQVTQALLHEPLHVAERCGTWASIVTAYDYPGWVELNAIEAREGSWPAPLSESPIAVAGTFLGSPYEWGGLTRSGIDCSGLVHLSYRLTGRLVPRDAWQQEQAGSRVEIGDAQPGDIAFYGTGHRADHVAFWLGEGRILHATAREHRGVVNEAEPRELELTRRGIVRL
jgi:gamma-D-glutamyl-L-lysine dipeptidyl-peptidase